MSARVVFRADGTPAIGGGHVMRSLALASAFADAGWTIGFAASQDSFKAMPQLAGASCEKLALAGDAASEAAAMAAQWPDGCELLVVDHYERDETFERACRPWAKRILVIDDLANRPHDADVLVDSGADSPSRYENLVASSCRVLTGPAFAVVHPGFLLAREAALPRRDGRPVARILVSFGQTDPDNATALALDAIELAGFTGAVDVVLGQSAPHLSAIRRRAKNRITLHVNASNMPALMATSDLAIGAGGTTAFERCCLGLPCLMLQIAENQRNVIKTVSAAGAGIDCGLVSSASAERLAQALREILQDAAQRQRLAAAAFALVDGRSAKRILLQTIAPVAPDGGPVIAIRLAEASDEDWLYELQSHSVTRRHFQNPAIPTRDEHAAWMSRVLKNPDIVLAIVEASGERVGMVRLDRTADGEGISYTVSIAIDPARHGAGLGRAALGLLRRLTPSAVLNAKVLPENDRSKRLFESCGYEYVGDDWYRSRPEDQNCPRPDRP